MTSFLCLFDFSFVSAYGLWSRSRSWCSNGANDTARWPFWICSVSYMFYFVDGRKILLALGALWFIGYFLQCYVKIILLVIKCHLILSSTWSYLNNNKWPCSISLWSKEKKIRKGLIITDCLNNIAFRSKWTICKARTLIAKPCKCASWEYVTYYSTGTNIIIFSFI